MFKSNKNHLQPEMFSTVNQLPEKHQARLESSWAGTFYREVFCRIDEAAFAVLYSDTASRPNTPVNILVSFEILKAGKGWSDEELYEHFLFDIQTRYALGYRNLGDGLFAIRTLYYFRDRLSEYYLKTGINLLASAFTEITDAQIVDLAVQTNVQRMDSTQIASNIVNSSRLRLLVEGIQRTHKILSKEEKSRLEEVYAPYLKGSSDHYSYRVKGEDANKSHLQKVGATMQSLLKELGENYSGENAYLVLERLFSEHFKLVEKELKLKEKEEISSGSLQSVDDLEASYRKKAGKSYQGFVANITETCEPENDLQLVTNVQVEPNNVDDDKMLADALPELKERTDVKKIHLDGGYGGEASDPILEDLSVDIIQSAIRGQKEKSEKLHLSEFDIQQDQNGHPLQIRCPQGQTVPVKLARKTGWQARFDPEICGSCPFHTEGRCKAKAQKRDPRYMLSFTMKELRAAKRRRNYTLYKKEKGNLRAAAEATMRSAKLPFPAGKLPVRGIFRVTSMMIASVLHLNMRRIWKYETDISLSDFIFQLFSQKTTPVRLA
ncbi:MAG: transposase [Thermodesulfobacteriota bacterium]|nr:transposase [Thermodesulfobacteriota bacterium]